MICNGSIALHHFMRNYVHAIYNKPTYAPHSSGCSPSRAKKGLEHP